LLFTAMFHFEADDITAAEEAVGGWQVSPGTTLLSLSGSQISERAPLRMEEGGSVSDGVAFVTQPEATPLPADES
jgi:hypothetical protein